MRGVFDKTFYNKNNDREKKNIFLFKKEMSTIHYLLYEIILNYIKHKIKQDYALKVCIVATQYIYNSKDKKPIAEYIYIYI